MSQWVVIGHQARIHVMGLKQPSVFEIQEVVNGCCEGTYTQMFACRRAYSLSVYQEQ